MIDSLFKPLSNCFVTGHSLTRRFLLVGLLLPLMGFPGQGQAGYEFVRQFGSTGTATGQFNAPRGVTVNSQGKIIITESGNDRVQICDETGTACTAFGVFGTLTGEFDRPRGVDIDSQDRIFVADRGNSRIQRCSDFGSCSDFGGSGTAVGRFASPRGIAVDTQDRVNITDTGNNRIQICNNLGQGCTAFGSFGTALGRFDSPAGVDINSEGKLVIADRGNQRIQTCTTTGVCTAFGSAGTSLAQFNGPAGIAINSQGEIIVVDRFNDRIQVCTEDGTCTAFGSTGSGPGQFNIPWGVAVDSQDRIIVADLGNDRIQIFANQNQSPAVSIDSFEAAPVSIQEGDNTTLSWAVSHATSCTASGGTTAWSSSSPNATVGSLTVTIATAGAYTFTLQCTDGVTSDTANVAVTVSLPPLLEMNPGLNDAWFNPATDGQGFFITVFPDLGAATLAWFTYDTVPPAGGLTANLGSPGHRWLTALGVYAGNQAVMDITISSGGLFDTPTAIDRVSDGTIVLSFSDCNTGSVEYDIPSIDQQGVVPIQRVAADNIALCKALATSP